MKKTIFILIGILVGSLMTLAVQILHNRNQPSSAIVEGIKNNLGTDKIRVLSTDQLFINEITGSSLHSFQVISAKHPEMFVVIDLQNGGIHQLSVHDKNNTFASFMDKNSDGTWDFRDFSNDDSTYAYGRGTGYPDTIIQDSNAVIRIDGQYYKMLNQDAKQYISIDGKLVEIEGMKWGYFKIKE